MWVEAEKRSLASLLKTSKKENEELAVSIISSSWKGQTLAEITERYYWPDMHNEVCAYVSG